ncbi:MAG: DUF7005 family protein [Saccharofermentanales bacterium]|jgi:hypothetical protein
MVMYEDQRPLAVLTQRYPQLTLAVEAGMSQSDKYRAITQRGMMPVALPYTFSDSEATELYTEHTEAGDVEILVLPDRGDFVRFVQVMAYRCEPREVPPSMGAVTINNINNWRRIEAHKNEYLLSGKTDWEEEFKRFTVVPQNYRDSIIALSNGAYSALPYTETNCESDEEWIRASLTIRKYHELTHFVSRRLFPDNKETLRDEVLADCVGIVAAFGKYDIFLAQRVLGIYGDEYRTGGRLANYTESHEELALWVARAIKLTEIVFGFVKAHSELTPLQLQLLLEREGIGL